MGLGRGVLSRNGTALDGRCDVNDLENEGEARVRAAYGRQVRTPIADQGEIRTPTTFFASTKNIAPATQPSWHAR